MSALDEARAHLVKATDFLTAAELNLELGLDDVATSNAVISGINAKDAVCVRLTGTTAKTENHASAVAELRAAGGNGPHRGTVQQMAAALGRLLKLKNRSQYQALAVARTDAEKAVAWAQKMLDGAAGILRE